MPLTQAQEDAEFELRIQQMQTYVEKMRSDIRYEGRKFFVQAVVGIAVAMGAGVALATFVNNRVPPAPPPPPQITVSPAQITVPPAQIIIIPAPSSPGHT